VKAFLPIRSTIIYANDQSNEVTVDLYSPARNALSAREKAGPPRPGRHARPASPPAGVLSDVHRDRSLERIRAAAQALADAYSRLRGAAADSDAVDEAFATARESLKEAEEAVRETLRERALILNEWEQSHRPRQNPGRYSGTAAPVVPDAPGENLCPDPAAARTPAEFMDTLRRYRRWAGDPSYRAMETIIKNQCGRPMSASTIHAALKGDSLPALAKVQAIITACGGRDTHQQMFTTAWRRLVMPRHDGEQPARPSAHPSPGEPA
jgi:hypothetical protein